MSLLRTTALLLLLAACGTAAGPGAPAAPSGLLEAPERIDFGVVDLGARAERVLALRNVGEGMLVVDAVELPAPFEGGAPPTILAPGAALLVRIVWTATGRGPVSVLATVRAQGTARDVRLEAVGGGSPLRCSPEAVELGRPVVGTRRTVQVDCANAGREALAIAVDWTPGLTWTPATPVVVRPGGRGSFVFEYRPADLSPLSTTVRLADDGVVLAEVPVSATPISTAVRRAPELACPGGLALGFAAPGRGIGRSVSLGNAGDRPLGVTAVEVEGPFSFSPAPPFEIPADDPATPEDEGTVEAVVTFSPVGSGYAGGSIRLAFDDPGTPRWTGCLSGFGGGPAIACWPDALDFGPTSSALPRTRTVVCTNVGNDVPDTDDDRLRLSALVARGAGFSVRGAPPAEGLGPAEAVALEVTFAPEAGGPATGVLALESNDPAAPLLELPLAGEGIVSAP